MTDLIAAEFLKLRTTRTFWVLIGLSVLLVALTTFAQCASDLPDSEDKARDLISNIGTAGLLMLILGIVSSAGEYRHRTITATFLTAPDRRRVLIAKTLVAGAVGAALAIACLLIVLAIALPWLNADGRSLGSLGYGFSDLLADFGRQGAYVFLTAMFAVGIGALLTNQVAALAVVPLLVILIDPLLTLLSDAYGTYSLTGIWSSLGGETSDDSSVPLLQPGVAALLYLGYVAALVGITAEVDRRRDVA